MDEAQLIKQLDRIIAGMDDDTAIAFAEGAEFLRVYAGEKSAFYKEYREINRTWSDDYIRELAKGYLRGFRNYVQNGLHKGISIERKAQIDIVSDILGQAGVLLETSGVHPAGPAMLIGASLEEFLRNWVEDSNLSLGNKKPSIDSYTKVLRENELISKQDDKDVTSWAGLRNHAAHGEWEEVSEKNRISLMLEGVNLFMRKYGHQ